MKTENLLWLVKSLKYQHDSRIKAAITSGERRDEGKRRKKASRFWIACEQLVVGVETYVNLMVQRFIFFLLLLLIGVPCIFIRKLQPLCS